MPGPIHVFRRTIQFELYEIEGLNRRQKTVVLAAIGAQAESKDTKVHAGAAALARNGKLVASSNDIPGSFGHAEQRAVSQLYQILPAGQKKLRSVGLGVCLAGDELIRECKKYTAQTAFNEIMSSKPCGKCLEFIADVSANVRDVEFLLILVTGQVIRTTLRSLLTWPYVSMQVGYDPELCRPIYRETTHDDQKK